MAHISDIKGYKKEVEKLNSICDFLKNTNKYVKLGVDLPVCLLICGQKGVGKTFAAEALANDSEREIFTISSFDASVRKIKKAFNAARKAAHSIVLIDDVDYLDVKEDKDEFDQIHLEMDDCKNGEVFVIMTADEKENLPKHLVNSIDPDLIMELQPPTIEEACEVFQPIFNKFKLANDFNALNFCCFVIEQTYTYVEELFNKALRIAVYEGCEKISMQHLVKSTLLMKGYEPATEFDIGTAYHEVGHAVVNLLLGGDAAFIVLYGNCGGYFEEKNWRQETYEDLERRYVVRVAGKACEEISTGSTSLGSKKDLKRAAEDIEQDVKVLASQGFEYYDPTELNSPAYNDALTKKVQADLQRYYDKAKELLLENRALVDKLVEKLKEKFYLLHSEIYEIYNEYIKAKK